MKRFLALALLVLLGCKDQKTSDNADNSSIRPKYAKGFWVESHEGYRDLFVQKSSDSTSAVTQYRLVAPGGSVPNVSNVTTINVPISNLVCTSTTHIPLLDYLGSSDKLIGFPSTKYISSPIMRNRIDDGLVKEL